MIDEMLRMAAAREELSATHAMRSQRVIRPIMPDATGERMICSTFAGSDMCYRLERLTDADLRPYARPGWNVQRPTRQAPDLGSTLNVLSVYNGGIAEALVIAWRWEIPVLFPYKKADGTERDVRGVITWAADEHGAGEVLGMLDADRKAPRTYKVASIRTVQLLPARGQTLPTWSGDGWISSAASTWGELAKAAASGARG
jgi:hypothetical protein